MSGEEKRMTKEEAIEILSEMRAEYNIFGDEEEATRYHVLSMAIKAMRADPVKHGRWEYIGGYGYQYRCSNCVKCAEHRSAYCPNCGARMEGEEDERNSDVIS